MTWATTFGGSVATAAKGLRLRAWAKREFDRLRPLASEAVVFRSPAFFLPYPGVEALVHIIATVNTVFEDFAYHREFWSKDADSVVLEFSARLGDKRLKGIDIISFDEGGKIREFEVMIRPANAAVAVGEAMAAKAGPRLKEVSSQAAHGAAANRAARRSEKTRVVSLPGRRRAVAWPMTTALVLPTSAKPRRCLPLPHAAVRLNRQGFLAIWRDLERALCVAARKTPPPS